jgi:hypothetical protein
MNTQKTVIAQTVSSNVTTVNQPTIATFEQLAPKFSKAFDDQRKAAVYINAVLLQQTAVHKNLSIQDCAKLLGFSKVVYGSTNKTKKMEFSRANSLQRIAKQWSELLALPVKSQTIFDQAMAIINSTDFLADTVNLTPLEMLAFDNNHYISNGSEFRDFFRSLMVQEIEQASNNTSDQNNGTENNGTENNGTENNGTENNGDQTDTDSSKNALDQAGMFDVIVKALAEVAKLTEVQAVAAHMANVWQADRKDLLARMDLLETTAEKMADTAIKQAEIINTLKAKQPKTDLKVKMEQAAAKGKELDDLKRKVESLTKQLEAARASQLAKAS